MSIGLIIIIIFVVVVALIVIIKINILIFDHYRPNNDFILHSKLQYSIYVINSKLSNIKLFFYSFNFTEYR